MTPAYTIQEMTIQERNKLITKHPGLMKYWELWKLWISGHGWHYGFLSREQAEFAMLHRGSPEESYYVKDDVAVRTVKPFGRR